MTVRAPVVPALNPPAGQLGQVNALLSARGRRHFVHEFPGPLSIKHVLDGRVTWKLGRREIVVDSSSFLVVHDGEPYSMHLDEPRPVRTCCPFFERGFVESAAACVAGGQVALLDDPRGGFERLEFTPQLWRDEGRMSSRLRALTAAMGRADTDPLEIDAAFLDLARSLVLLQDEVRLRAARLTAVRAGTRMEEMRRLARAVEFIHGHAHEPLTVKRIARGACLSEFHFHRLFTAVFHETPHAYVTRLRLDRARALLGRDMPVTEVCAEVGFASPGSFSTLFRRRFGIPPSRVRSA